MVAHLVGSWLRAAPQSLGEGTHLMPTVDPACFLEKGLDPGLTMEKKTKKQKQGLRDILYGPEVRKYFNENISIGHRNQLERAPTDQIGPV